MYDIDVLIQLAEGQDMLAVRDRLEELDEHFVNAGLKFFFVQHPDSQFCREELLRGCADIVLIETLAAGALGLPTVAGPTYKVPFYDIPILHPTILILTKLKRWSTTHPSTRPQTITKTRIDKNDITFMLTYLFSHSLHIEFTKYAGKSREELVRMVKGFYDKLVEGGEDGTVRTLKGVMYNEDWEMMVGLPVEAEESLVPPIN
ncbi:hypothetical protein BDY19DRAFT_992689 [Irpex rosettiformis]|uniref:Uncharacterized protein n=1 Tax=Irpex rosettiformis TaxID=378272 RepID=A0ACB8U676_9APHY|nr:hypothetical protein BDY19DRAFT_992689 [Irpex rosettiformis]